MYLGFIVMRNSKTCRHGNDCHEVFTHSFKETGNTGCHAGPHRETAGLDGGQKEGEDSWGKSLLLWFSWEMRSEAGYERQTD